MSMTTDAAKATKGKEKGKSKPKGSVPAEIEVSEFFNGSQNN